MSIDRRLLFSPFSKEESRGCGTVRWLIRTSHWSRDRQTAVICQVSSLWTMYTVNFVVKLPIDWTSTCMYGADILITSLLTYFLRFVFATCARGKVFQANLIIELENFLSDWSRPGPPHDVNECGSKMHSYALCFFHKDEYQMIFKSLSFRYKLRKLNYSIC
jgi:hypothetical protein